MLHRIEQKVDRQGTRKEGGFKMENGAQVGGQTGSQLKGQKKEESSERFRVDGSSGE